MPTARKKVYRRPGGRSERIRCAVLTAARELMSPGQSLPAMADIAQRAGVDKTSLYRRWGNVETLVHEALGVQPFKGVAVPDKGSLRQDLVAFVTETHHFLSSPEQNILVESLLGLPSDLKQEYWRNRYRELSRLFDCAVKRGEVRKRDDWTLYIDLLNAPWYYYRWAKGDNIPLATLLSIVTMICSDLLC